MSHFLFDAEAHVYAMMPGSRHVPSVTQVLEHVGITPDFSHLPIYYRDRGRAIHTAMALELVGELDWNTLDERVRPFIERARAWLDMMDVTPLVIEHRWACKIHEYGGTLDLFCESKLGPMLVDWKAVSFDASYGIQVAGGYAPMLEQAAEEGAVPVAPGDVRKARIAVVTLGTDVPKIHWIPRANNVELFRAALAVTKWRLAHRR